MKNHVKFRRDSQFINSMNNLYKTRYMYKTTKDMYPLN